MSARRHFVLEILYGRLIPAQGIFETRYFDRYTFGTVLLLALLDSAYVRATALVIKTFHAVLGFGLQLREKRVNVVFVAGSFFLLLFPDVFQDEFDHDGIENNAGKRCSVSLPIESLVVRSRITNSLFRNRYQAAGAEAFHPKDEQACRVQL